jgi:hypothetical protein
LRGRRATAEATVDGLEPSTPAAWSDSVGCECDADAMVVACISEMMMMMMMIGKVMSEWD